MLNLDRFFSGHRPPKLKNYRPFVSGGETAGYIDQALVEQIPRDSDIFEVGREAVVLAGNGLRQSELNTAFDAAIRDIYDMDQTGFGMWCPETTPVVSDFGRQPLFEIQRAAVGFFGVLTTGVHLNVYSHGADGPVLHIARRAKHLASHPGLLDQAVAGFLPVGGSPLEKLAEESFDEAGLPESLVRRAKPVGSIAFAINRDPGLQRGAVYVFDLEITPDHKLINLDGEVDAYLTMTPGEATDGLNAGQFKFDSALVVVDFLLRHGCLDCESAGYLNIRTHLHGMGEFRN